MTVSTLGIKCSAKDGMFPDEYAVQIESLGQTHSLFAEKEKVIESKGQRILLVDLVDSVSGTVRLPADTFEEGRRNIQVSSEMIVSL